MSLEQIEIIVDGIEQDLARSGRREVPTETIGQMAMAHLRGVDDVAYVRFASVYRSFASVDEFLAVLRSLQAEKDDHA